MTDFDSPGGDPVGLLPVDGVRCPRGGSEGVFALGEGEHVLAVLSTLINTVYDENNTKGHIIRKSTKITRPLSDR